MKKCLAIALLFAASAPAYADQVWRTDKGEITLVEDLGSVAHWSWVQPGIGSLDIFLEGRGGVTATQGFYSGYWLAQEGTHALDETRACVSELVGANGSASHRWGEVWVDFDAAGTPGGFTINLGNCFMSAYDGDSTPAAPL